MSKRTVRSPYSSGRTSRRAHLNLGLDHLLLLQREHHLDQRIAAQLALGLQLLDELLERQILVGEGLKRGAPDAAEHLAKGRIARRVARAAPSC